MARPRHYDTPEEFDAMVDDYVTTRVAEDKPLSWTGLALHLGFGGRSCIDEYANYDGFSYSVKRAKTIIENYYEEATINGDMPVPMGLFGLKNFKWKDKFEEDANREIPEIKIVLPDGYKS